MPWEQDHAGSIPVTLTFGRANNILYEQEIHLSRLNYPMMVPGQRVQRQPSYAMSPMIGNDAPPAPNLMRQNMGLDPRGPSNPQTLMMNQQRQLASGQTQIQAGQRMLNSPTPSAPIPMGKWAESGNLSPTMLQMLVHGAEQQGTDPAQVAAKYGAIGKGVPTSPQAPYSTLSNDFVLRGSGAGSQPSDRPLYAIRDAHSTPYSPEQMMHTQQAEGGRMIASGEAQIGMVPPTEREQFNAGNELAQTIAGGPAAAAETRARSVTDAATINAKGRVDAAKESAKRPVGGSGVSGQARPMDYNAALGHFTKMTVPIDPSKPASQENTRYVTPDEAQKLARAWVQGNAPPTTQPSATTYAGGDGAKPISEANAGGSPAQIVKSGWETRPDGTRVRVHQLNNGSLSYEQ